MFPGRLFCPRKPHTFGNDYHSICYGLSGIVFDIELVEGKDFPGDTPPDIYEKIGNVVGLLVRLCHNIY